MQDAFRSLTGSGIKFNKSRFANDIKPFEAKKATASTSKAPLPDALDFFSTSPAGDDAGSIPGESKTASKKRKRAAMAVAAAGESITTTTTAGAGASALEISAALLSKHKIKLTGLSPPQPIPSPPSQLASNWARLGLGEPSGVQCAAWGVMMEGREVVACAPTGSGKTLAFLVPLLALTQPQVESDVEGKGAGPSVVILEPTRELAMQVLREARKLAGPEGKWKVGVLGDTVGGGNKRKKSKKGKRAKGKGKGKKVEETNAVVEELAEESEEEESDDDEEEEEEVEVKEEVAMAEVAVAPAEEDKEPSPSSLDILITTPLRLVYLLQQKKISLASVTHLILDEADHLFTPNFLLQTDHILAACTNKALKKGLFSATLPSSVEELANSILNDAVRIVVGHKDSASATISQSLQFVHSESHKLPTLLSLFQTGQLPTPTLLFVQSILRAKELSHALLLEGISADCLHAEMSGEERDEVVRRFAKGEVWVLVGTDVLGRGVDFKGVKSVVNYDFPQSGGSYVHRIGRTGRAGKEGKAVTFFTKYDGTYLRSIVNIMRSSGCSIEPWMLELKNPSQDEKNKLKRKPPPRKDIGDMRKEKGGKGRKRTRVMGAPDGSTGKKSKVSVEE